MRTNILFTHFFSRQNKGDAAILSAMIKEIRSVFPDSSMSVLTCEPSDNNSEYEGLPTFESFFYQAIYKRPSAIGRILSTIYVLNVTLIYAIFYRYLKLKLNIILTKSLRRIINQYRNANLVIAVGGGYITGANTLRGNLTVILQLHGLIIPILLRKKVFLYSQSIGPFGNNFQRKISGLVLNKTTKLFIREDISIAELKLIGIKKDIIAKTPDAAFMFTSDSKELMRDQLIKTGVDFSKKIVGVTAKNFLPVDRQMLYERSLANLINQLMETGRYNVLFIPQVTATFHNDDDRRVNEKIFRLLHSQKGVFNLKNIDSHYDIKGIYENLNYLVGTRMHSCIFALTSLVPVIAIEYEYKTRGMMKDLGLENWCIKIEDVTASLLVEKFHLLINEEKKYLQILQQIIPKYIETAKKTKLILKNDYNQDKYE